MSVELVAALLERPVAFHPVFKSVAGSTVGAVFLSQMYYWSTGDRYPSDRRGWVYKTQADWLEETALSRSEQERARRDLKDKGLLKERRGHPNGMMYFWLDKELLYKLIIECAKSRPPRKKANKNKGMQDSAVDGGSDEKANKNKGVQDSAVGGMSGVSDSVDNSVKSNKNKGMQNPAVESAESCSLECRILQSNTESTTENTSESTAGSSTRVGSVQNVFQEPSADTREKFSMHEDWRVSESFQKQCGIRGLMLDKLDPDRLVDEVRDFVGYWMARPEVTNPQSLWEHKLTQHLQRGVRRGVFNTEVNHGYASQSSNSGKPKSAAQVHAESCAGAFDQYASGGAGYGEAWADAGGEAGAIDGEWSGGSASAERFD